MASFCLLLELRHRLGHDLVEDAGSLTATEHQHPERTLARGEPVLRVRNLEDLVPYRVADMDRPTLGGKGPGEGFEHPTGPGPQPPIDQSRHRVLFVQNQGQAEQARRECAGSACISPHAEHQRGVVAAQAAPGGAEGDDEAKRGARTPAPGTGAQARHPQGDEIEAVPGHDARLQPGRGAKPHDAHRLPAQTLGDRQGGIDVPTRSPRRDDHGNGAGAVLARDALHRPRLDSSATRNSKPMAAQVTTMLEPP